MPGFPVKTICFEIEGTFKPSSFRILETLTKCIRLFNSFFTDFKPISELSSSINSSNDLSSFISKLLDGQTVEYIESKLKGNLCGGRGTSCADQLAIAVKTAYDECKK